MPMPSVIAVRSPRWCSRPVSEQSALEPSPIAVTLPDRLTAIADYTFSECGLTSVTIPESVNTIGKFAFAGCRGLVSATISETTAKSGEFAFYYCIGLTSFVIPKGVTEIDASTFRCSGLTSVTIPDGVTMIGHSAFSGCTTRLSWADWAGQR
eukprot:m.89165 g.89165  ORF g.89165 m.89165 type:complete len:153 (+) comp11709_c1_seq1:168-626(+)